MFRNRLPIFAAALALLVARGDLPAQPTMNSPAPRRVAVTVVLLDRLPQTDAPFVIQRRPDVAPRDLILLRSDATGAQLADAVHSLLMIRQASGDTSAAAVTMRMRPNRPLRGPRTQFPWIQRVLSDLKRAEFREVPGIGRARAVEIWLPPQGRRGQVQRAKS